MISDEERYSIAIAGEKRGFEKGVSEGIAKGREEGREQNRLDTAKKMLADGLPVEKISQYTDISIKDPRKPQ